MTTTTLERQTCFQLKTNFAPCTILQITHYDLEAIEQQLSITIQKAPNFFIGSPIIIDLEKVNDVKDLNFNKIKQILINQTMVPMGVRGGNEEQLQNAASSGLPTLTIGKLTSQTSSPSAEQTTTTNTTQTTKKKSAAIHPTKIITNPIRSGMQVYAKEADLIVIAPVSAGAELLADGNIHIYGPLRGRAMAGVQGDTTARIFCRTLEAELVSIAGYYLTKEDIQTHAENNGMIQIYLDNEQVRIETIS